MKTIASFTVNHDTLTPGIYVSRVDGDITTYDLRTRIPNSDNYMDNRTMHSVEHMFATYIRNSSLNERVIYFGPMGCQTGFYLLIRDADNLEVLEIVKTVLRQILAHDGEMFGMERKACGNWQNLSVEDAKAECSQYLAVLESKEHDFTYKD